MKLLKSYSSLIYSGTYSLGLLKGMAMAEESPFTPVHAPLVGQMLTSVMCGGGLNLFLLTLVASCPVTKIFFLGHVREKLTLIITLILEVFMSTRLVQGRVYVS